MSVYNDGDQELVGSMIAVVVELEPQFFVGDQVLLKSPKPHEPLYVALVDKLESINKRNGIVEVKAIVQWYYTPEHTSKGRKDYHWTKEMFPSDHCDDQTAHCITGKCTERSFKEYVKLGNVGDDEYYSRYKYNAKTEESVLHDLDGWCKCGLLYNPEYHPAEKGMLQYYGCKLRYHPACVGMEIALARRTCLHYCDKCDDPPSEPERRNSPGQEQAAEDGEKSEHKAKTRTKRRR